MTKNVAFILNAIDDFERGVLQGALRYALACPSWRWATPQNVPTLPESLLRRWRGDGAIVDVDARTFVRLQRRGIHVVNIRSSIGPCTPSVTCDNEAIGRLAAEHLLQRGLRKFATLDLTVSPLVRERGEAFARHIRQAGGELTILPFERSSGRDVTHLFNIRPLMRQLKRIGPPVGVFGFHDPVARQIALACVEAGLRVPEDIAIIGVNNSRLLCELSTPPLSSVDINSEGIGYRAAAVLDDLLNGRPAPAEPIRIPPLGVIERQSTNTLAVDDAMTRAALQFVQDRMHQPIQVDDILEQIPISRRSLEIRFQRYLHTTVHDHLRRVRIRRACLLLAQTDRLIPDVARLCGFTDQRPFLTSFRKETGLTPSQYRRAHQRR